MVWPILISVSVTPGPYFLSANAVLSPTVRETPTTKNSRRAVNMISPCVEFRLLSTLSVISIHGVVNNESSLVPVTFLATFSTSALGRPLQLIPPASPDPKTKSTTDDHLGGLLAAVSGRVKVKVRAVL